MPASDASLDDLSSTDSYDSDEEYRLAQQEWEESLQQLQQLVAVVLLPYVGKWLGRRWSHILYARYLRIGLNKAFFFGGSPAP
ncbi:hypothetical protein CVT26_002703 [Gymnopilus dilepis]|uniref:Uncharacterized protein n=1 Tax=Gymnopilus dilepis TaxID=231916 RepID=A0A409VDA8_9AGAR|nr:hypothetical protein CVT26_002703 [Gymnopilus dilepis]